jgi:hypothetical protein
MYTDRFSVISSSEILKYRPCFMYGLHIVELLRFLLIWVSKVTNNVIFRVFGDGRKPPCKCFLVTYVMPIGVKTPVLWNTLYSATYGQANYLHTYFSLFPYSTVRGSHTLHASSSNLSFDWCAVSGTGCCIPNCCCHLSVAVPDFNLA